MAKNMAFAAESTESPTKRRRAAVEDSPEVLREAAAEGLQGLVEPLHGEESVSPLKGIDTAADSPMPEFPEEMPGIDADFGMEDETFTPDAGGHLMADGTQLMEDVQGTQQDSVEDSQKTGWSARTRESLARIKKSIKKPDQKFSFPEVVAQVEKGPERRKAAQQFFEMLVLHSRSVVVMEQSEPMGDIMIGQGAKFHQTVC